MYIYIYVYIYMYIHIHMYKYVYIYIYIHGVEVLDRHGAECRLVLHLFGTLLQLLADPLLHLQPRGRWETFWSNRPGIVRGVGSLSSVGLCVGRCGGGECSFPQGVRETSTRGWRKGVWEVFWCNLIAASIYDKYSVGPSILPIGTRCCFTMTNLIQMCSNFHRDRVSIMDTRPDDRQPHRAIRPNHAAGDISSTEIATLDLNSRG